MVTFILIHGSWHGAWCWNKLLPVIKDAGQTAIALDMPGRGNNPAPIEDQTLSNYVATTIEAIDLSKEAVYLVGHSAGGAVISQAAEERPARVESLIYLAAFMLTDGQSVLDIAGNDEGNEILPAAEFIEDGKAIVISPDKARKPLYMDCSEEDSNWAIEQLVAEATEPVGANIKLTAENYGRIPRFYIECLQDRGISPKSQRAMIAAQPPERVITMNTSHSPFISKPKELAGHLLSILR